MEGWISLHRKIKEHWIWGNSFYLKAWIQLILDVNFEDNKVLIEGELIDCQRGQSVKSLKTWSKDFGKNWTIQKVRTFFKLLENDHMIILEGLRKTTRITICKYDSYQLMQHTDNKEITHKQHTNNKEITTKQHQLNKDNNDNNENNTYVDFEIFWNLYNKKVGARKKCETKWYKLKSDTQHKIIDTLPKFINQFSDKQYQPFPETYLNQERWNDEVQIKQQEQTPYPYKKYDPNGKN